MKKYYNSILVWNEISDMVLPISTCRNMSSFALPLDVLLVKQNKVANN